MSNEYVEVFSLPNGYDKGKTRVHLRHITFNEIPTMRGEYWIADRKGYARTVRVSSSVKSWKKDSTRFEVSFKYGMYESFRFNTKEILENIMVPV